MRSEELSPLPMGEGAVVGEERAIRMRVRVS